MRTARVFLLLVVCTVVLVGASVLRTPDRLAVDIGEPLTIERCEP